MILFSCYEVMGHQILITIADILKSVWVYSSRWINCCYSLGDRLHSVPAVLFLVVVKCSLTHTGRHHCDGTEGDGGRRRMTEVDGRGRRETEGNGGRRRVTEMDGRGRRETEGNGGRRKGMEGDGG